MNAVSVPLPDPPDRPGRELRPPRDQPLPVQRVTHLESVDCAEFPRVPASPHETRQCAHWPLDAGLRIQAVAHALRALAAPWGTDEFAYLHASRRTGCIDLDQPISGAPGAALVQRLAALSAELQAQKMVLRSLADDHATVNVWLCGAAGSSLDATRAARQRLGPALATAESHRVIAKDWLTADMNALVCGVLRRAVGVLDRWDTSPDALRADLAVHRAGGAILRIAAEMLDRAVSLSCDAALFVEEYDQRWQQVRYRVADALALASNLGHTPHP